MRAEPAPRQSASRASWSAERRPIAVLKDGGIEVSGLGLHDVLGDPPPSQSRCAPAIFLGLWPPIWPGATLPVVATRFSQLIAVLSLTPKRAAACRRESPSCATAATTRSRRSIE